MATSLKRTINVCKIYQAILYLYQLWQFGEDLSSSSWELVAHTSITEKNKKK